MDVLLGRLTQTAFDLRLLGSQDSACLPVAAPACRRRHLRLSSRGRVWSGGQHPDPVYSKSQAAALRKDPLPAALRRVAVALVWAQPPRRAAKTSRLAGAAAVAGSRTNGRVRMKFEQRVSVVRRRGLRGQPLSGATPAVRLC